MQKKKITVEEAASLMGKSKMFVRIGLRNKTLPFGFAVMMESGRWSYYINPKQFYEYIGKDE
jgi:hypothetical protein